jgi:hypothetical protein
VALEESNGLAKNLRILFFGEPRHACDDGVVATLTSSRGPTNRI